MPNDFVVFGKEKIPVLRANGEKAFLEPFSVVSTSHPSRSISGLMLSDDPQRLEIVLDGNGNYRVVETGEVLRPIEE